MKYPDYKSLKINNMHNLNQEELKDFMKKSRPDHLQNVYLEYNGGKVDPIIDDMCETIEVCTGEVFLDKMRFNEIGLSKILNSASKAERVVFKDCTFGISNKFKAADSNYKLGVMNLYGTFKDDQKSFEYFIKGLKSTNLKSNKFELQLASSDFESKPKKKSKKKNNVDDEEFEMDVDEELLNELKDIIQGLSFTYEIRNAGDYTYEGQTVGNEIAGHGVYTHNRDKNVKKVHFCHDLVHQYEESTNPDGSTYKGYVRNGLKHGIGIYSNKKNKDKDDDLIYGLYIHDELKYEFSKKEASEINKGNFKAVEYFKKNRKHEKYVRDDQKFQPPKNFDLIMGEVNARIRQLKNEKKREKEFKYYEKPYFLTREGEQLEEKHRKEIERRLRKSSPAKDEEDTGVGDDASDPSSIVKTNKLSGCKVKMMNKPPTPAS